VPDPQAVPTMGGSSWHAGWSLGSAGYSVHGDLVTGGPSSELHWVEGKAALLEGCVVANEEGYMDSCVVELPLATQLAEKWGWLVAQKDSVIAQLLLAHGGGVTWNHCRSGRSTGVRALTRNQSSVGRMAEQEGSLEGEEVGSARRRSGPSQADQAT
jgi:hypothetical protein